MSQFFLINADDFSTLASSVEPYLSAFKRDLFKMDAGYDCETVLLNFEVKEKFL